MSFFKNLLLSGCLFSGTMQTVHSSNLQVVLLNATPHDAQIILNVLYWSHARSAATYQTQNHALSSIKQHLLLWDSCIARRLNPNAAEAPSLISSTPCHTFADTVSIFHTVQSIYAHMVDFALEPGNFDDPRVVEALLAIRQNVRAAVVLEVKELLQEIRQALAEIIQHHFKTIPLHEDLLSWAANDLEDDLDACEARYKTGITDLFTNLTTYFALSSFATFDKECQDQCLFLTNVYVEFHEQLNRLWNAIESVRVQTYAEQYLLAHKTMRELHMPEEAFYNIFTASGFNPNTNERLILEKLPKHIFTRPTETYDSHPTRYPFI